jgi:hypothetical protein
MPAIAGRWTQLSPEYVRFTDLAEETHALFKAGSQEYRRRLRHDSRGRHTQHGACGRSAGYV